MHAAFPKANITLRNGALPATPSSLMNMCLEQYVDAAVDLVFVEYVANDGSNRCVQHTCHFAQLTRAPTACHYGRAAGTP